MPEPSRAVSLVRDLGLVVGVGLVGYGLWGVSPPVSLAVVGAIVLWVCLPPRAPFIRG